MARAAIREEPLGTIIASHGPKEQTKEKNLLVGQQQQKQQALTLRRSSQKERVQYPSEIANMCHDLHIDNLIFRSARTPVAPAVLRFQIR